MILIEKQVFRHVVLLCFSDVFFFCFQQQQQRVIATNSMWQSDMDIWSPSSSAVPLSSSVKLFFFFFSFLFSLKFFRFGKGLGIGFSFVVSWFSSIFCACWLWSCRCFWWKLFFCDEWGSCQYWCRILLCCVGHGISWMCCEHSGLFATRLCSGCSIGGEYSFF